MVDKIVYLTLTENVASIIQKKIINGHILPGDRIIEEELSRELNVSRGPIREAFRKLEYDGLIVTTILERGVTFTHCHVCIVGSESPMYSRAALVQMSGRVGRRADFPTGELIYAHNGINKKMKEARQEIQQMNQLALERGLIAYH